MNAKLFLRYFSLVLLIYIILMTPSSFAQVTGYAGGILETYQHGKLNGDYIFTHGNSKYSGEIPQGAKYNVVFDTALPEGSKIRVARLYIYWTWSHNRSIGTYPEMEVVFENKSLEPDREYTDRKGSGNYDYPSGTYAYNVTDLIKNDAGHLSVINSGTDKVFTINGAGLLLIYENANKQVMEYWIDEGCDIINAVDGITSEQATTTSYFKGDIDTANISNAQLITVVPGGNKGKNTLYFNSKSWMGVYKGFPYADLAIDSRDVADYLLSAENVVRIKDNGDYLVPSNAFLILKFTESPSGHGSGMAKTPGFEAIWIVAAFLVIISTLRYFKRDKK